MNWQQWGCILLLSLFWGGSFFSTKVALDAFHPVFIVWMRLACAACVLWCCVIIMRVSVPRSVNVWLQLAFLGAVNNVVPFLFITWGQAHITASLASILNAMTPLFAIVIAHFFLADERLTVMKALGVCAGFIGVVMIGFDALTGLSLTHLAQLAIVCAAMSYATASVYARRFASISPFVLAFAQTLLASLMVGAACIILDVPWMHTSPHTLEWLALISLGVVSTACAYILYFYVLKKSGATNVLLVTFLVPLTAIALGVLVLDERVLVNQILGAFAIVVGLSLVDGRLWRATRK